jgi:hypothetical protein
MRRIIVGFLLLAAFALALVLTPPSGARSLRVFDPDRLADLEAGMWQAYYAKQRTRLFGLLVTLLHEQYHYSWARATVQGVRLARAAATFGDLKDHPDVVLPDLVSAYEDVRRWTGAAFDAHAVAAAELAWWEARRQPGHSAPEQIGELIANEYALLYESTPAAMVTPALLRAQAAALHDAHPDHPDWSRIALLLRQSYRELRLALASANV